MATHYSILAWKIPWTVEPGELQSVGLQRLRHDRDSHTHLLVGVWIIHQGWGTFLPSFNAMFGMV